MKNINKSRLWLYIIIFLGVLILFNSTFDFLSFIFRPVVLFPISYLSYLILKIVGISIGFNGPVGLPGLYEYQLPYSVLQVTFGCTGIFALFILLSGIIAYPCSLRLKAVGIIFSAPVFYIYSILRIVIITMTAYINPSSIDFVHSYLMEIFNAAFILIVYIIWIRYVEKAG